MRVLVLEDESAIRSALVRALSRSGHSLRDAANLAEARQILQDFQPEVLVSDLKLPDGSGLELAAELGLPFIVMSGYAAFDEAVQALRLGCVDFFTKPVSIRDLRSRLEHLDGQQRAAGQVLVVPGAEPSLLQVVETQLQEQSLECWEFSWYNVADARAAFQAQPEAAKELRERQLLAELMQYVKEGRVVINRRDGCWQAALQADMAQVCGDADARHRQIASLADRCEWRQNGVWVELEHAS